MFYLRYLKNELVRRRARTIVTIVGLGLGVALVVSISSLSRGLDKAQKQTLNPLAGIGTDLTVTYQPATTTTANNGGGGGFGGGGGGFGGGANRDLVQANQSVITDLSKLGKPGTHFVHDFFLPGTQLTFQQSVAKQIGSLNGVAKVSSGLTLLAEHQSGVVPKIVATLKTQAKTVTQTFTRRVRPSASDFAKMQACLQKAGITFGGGGGGVGGGGGFGSGGGGLGGSTGGSGTSSGNRAALQKCLPSSLQHFRAQFTSPSQTLKQVLNPPQTNIQSTAYTIGGVDPTDPNMGVVTTAQLTKGAFLSPTSTTQALVASSYATKEKLKVGSIMNLNGTKFTVVGIVSPPLGGQSADVYLPLSQLQKLANEKGLANVVLVSADSSKDVGKVKQEISSALPQAQVASSKDVADQITGSLVSASNLSHDLGLALSVIAAVAAFLLAALLAFSSVGKRVRELGTLKALGWTQRMVVRQIAGESLAQGILGGIFGIALGVIVALAIDAFGPSLSASSTVDGNLLGLGASTARTATSSVSLTAPIGITVLAIGLGLALLGGLIAGTAGALRAARLRPADALRQME
ncbi:MAG TPA: ABC transporter permease [Gaiellaceae bacterium]|nr:ABC transporter permease [Gaiellaceae bacterium]